MQPAMLDIDPAENHRLLLQDGRRRQDLIDQATQSFAPHLLGKDGVLVIHLYSTNASLRKAVRELGGGKTIVVEHCEFTGRDRRGVNEVQHEGVQIPLPKSADIVVTKASLNSSTEWLAARLGALPVVLPEGEDYLRARLDKAGALVLVGSDQAK